MPAQMYLARTAAETVRITSLDYALWGLLGEWTGPGEHILWLTCPNDKCSQI